uniref:Uncharacterized protein n=1 Tax=Rhizophora mucronata TaxID=61149 RepID=A0A2P2PHP9_RHIMU
MSFYKCVMEQYAPAF